jgi:TP901 family phage tail tape measure protein
MATTVASLVVRISASVADFEKAMAGMEKKWARQGAKFQQIGRDLTTGLTLPIVAIGGLAVKAASDFESSFAGVRKTVDGVVDKGGNLTDFGKQLQQEFRNLAKEIPVSVNELNKIGEMAGQLGVKSENIMDFTKTIAAMGVATNLTTEQAADGMARFANITQMPMEKIGALGSVIVELGNKLAATESEILEFGLRIAGAGEIVGLTEDQILGIGAAFASVGVEAEAGGTAVQKALLDMQSAVTTGKNLDAFGGSAFATQFRANPGEAFVGFVEAVGRAGKGGEGMLRNAGIDDARQIRAETWR